MAVRILNTGLVWIQNWFGLSNTDAFGEQGRAAKNQFSAVPPNSAVSMDVGLVSLKPVVDVTGDLKVMKKTLN